MPTGYEALSRPDLVNIIRKIVGDQEGIEAQQLAQYLYQLGENSRILARAIDNLPSGGGGGDGVVWRVGTTDPSDAIGDDGDLYLNTTDSTFWEKMGGSWSRIGDLSGADGSVWHTGTGEPGGSVGENGDFYFRSDDATIWSKANGTWTQQADITGSTGDDGSTWLAGSGVPAGTLGNVGDMYFRTDNGFVYRKTGASIWSFQRDITGPQGERGTDGTDGTDGTAGIDGATWHFGTTDPAANVGSNGDFYLRTDLNTVWTKADGAWTQTGSLAGADGATWHRGTTDPNNNLGNNGDFYFRTDNATIWSKANGTWTQQADINGPAGSDGTDGDDGTDGTDGARWHSGSGEPSQSTGAVGDFFFRTDNGYVYEKTDATTWTFRRDITGPQGNAGIDGSTWHSGTTVPPNALGANGDYYLRTSDSTVWSKANGMWTQTGNLAGADAATWHQGTGEPGSSLGKNGDFYFRTDDATIWSRPSGTWVQQADINGPSGRDGTDGDDGDDGTDGSVWHSASGVPSNATGAVGDFYFRTDNGFVYEKTGETEWTFRRDITGPQGAAGIDGKTWHFGTTDPASSLGADGDLYLRTDASTVWTKASGSWTQTGSLDGSDGATWYTGTTDPASGLGADGDFYFRSDNATIWRKASGSWSQQADINGPAGSDGTDGTDGSVWRSGSGAPGGMLGDEGDWYFRTDNGFVYEKTAADAWTFRRDITGPQGAAGIDGSTWYSGTGQPAMSLGANGDFYLRLSDSTVWEKASGSWSQTGNLAGADAATWHQGTTDPSDTLGKNGDFYFRTDNATIWSKASGTWTQQADINGPAGRDGDDGDDGTDGTPGAQWHSASGVPGNDVGAVGDFYFRTDNGWVYEKTGTTTWTFRRDITGPQGSAGVDGRTWHFGTTDPANVLGANGDLYLRTDANTVWTKASGTWTRTGNLAGADGATWRTGTTDPTQSLGDDGDFYFRSDNATIWRKVNGAWAQQADINGPAGSDGTDGTPGTVWHSDSGVPGNAVGAVGDWYFRTDNGFVYEKTASETWTFRRDITGPQGDAGIDGATWHFGAGDPANTLGNNGDFYFRTGNSTVWTKASGTWSQTGSLAGADGATWHQGTTDPANALGDNGDFYFRTDNATIWSKSGGSWSQQADINGPAGNDGDDGSDGADGARWHSASGVPGNALGEVGDFYFRTDNGFVYEKTGAAAWTFRRDITGPQGSAGIDGATWHFGTTDPASNLGKNGDFYLRTDNNTVWTRSAGSWTNTGTLEGADGATWRTGTTDPANTLGEDGDFYFRSDEATIWRKSGGTWTEQADINGPAGNDGNDGAVWHSGSGVPGGSIGNVSDFFFRTDNGYVYEKTGATTWTFRRDITGPQGQKGDKGDEGDPGDDGRNGVDGRTWHFGSGDPSSQLGVDGDLYLRTTNNTVWTKASGSWSQTGSLEGSDGATWHTGTTNPQNALGSNGDFYFNSSSATIWRKASGTWTQQADINGDDGADGSVWHSGSGVPGNAVGAVGDWFFRTDNGYVYEKTASTTWTFRRDITGPQGAAGIDGATWRFGTNAPGTSLGANGDFYLRTSDNTVWTKANGAWSQTGNLSGADGATWHTGTTDPAGSLGANGDFYFRSDNATIWRKASGSWTQQADVNGDDGSDGSDGATWYSGSGIPDNATGDDGDWFFRTDNGFVYRKSSGQWVFQRDITGPQGERGDKGDKGDKGDEGERGRDGETTRWYPFAHGILYDNRNENSAVSSAGGAWRLERETHYEQDIVMPAYTRGTDYIAWGIASPYNLHRNTDDVIAGLTDRGSAIGLKRLVIVGGAATREANELYFDTPTAGTDDTGFESGLTLADNVEQATNAIRLTAAHGSVDLPGPSHWTGENNTVSVFDDAAPIEPTDGSSGVWWRQSVNITSVSANNVLIDAIAEALPSALVDDFIFHAVSVFDDEAPVTAGGSNGIWWRKASGPIEQSHRTDRVLVMWDASPNSDTVPRVLFEDGDPHRMWRVTLFGTPHSDSGRVIINVSSNNKDFTADAETSLRFAFRYKNRTLVVQIEDDFTEPYDFTPDNSAEVIAFVDFVLADADRATQNIDMVILDGSDVSPVNFTDLTINQAESVSAAYFSRIRMDRSSQVRANDGFAINLGDAVAELATSIPQANFTNNAARDLRFAFKYGTETLVVQIAEDFDDPYVFAPTNLSEVQAFADTIATDVNWQATQITVALLDGSDDSEVNLDDLTIPGPYVGRMPAADETRFRTWLGGLAQNGQVTLRITDGLRSDIRIGTADPIPWDEVRKIIVSEHDGDGVGHGNLYRNPTFDAGNLIVAFRRERANNEFDQVAFQMTDDVIDNGNATFTFPVQRTSLGTGHDEGTIDDIVPPLDSDYDVRFLIPALTVNEDFPTGRFSSWWFAEVDQDTADALDALDALDAWPDEAVTAANKATPGDNVAGDIVTLYRGSTSQTRSWNSVTGTWEEIEQRIDGNLVVHGTINADSLGARSVVVGKIAPGAVTPGTIAAEAVTTETIEAEAITAGKLAVDSVTATNILAQQINISHLNPNLLSDFGKPVRFTRTYTEAVPSNVLSIPDVLPSGDEIVYENMADLVVTRDTADENITIELAVDATEWIATYPTHSFFQQVSTKTGVELHRTQNETRYEDRERHTRRYTVTHLFWRKFRETTWEVRGGYEFRIPYDLMIDGSRVFRHTERYLIEHFTVVVKKYSAEYSGNREGGGRASYRTPFPSVDDTRVEVPYERTQRIPSQSVFVETLDSTVTPLNEQKRVNLRFGLYGSQYGILGTAKVSGVVLARERRPFA